MKIKKPDNIFQMAHIASRTCHKGYMEMIFFMFYGELNFFSTRSFMAAGGGGAPLANQLHK